MRNMSSGCTSITTSKAIINIFGHFFHFFSQLRQGSFGATLLEKKYIKNLDFEFSQNCTFSDFCPLCAHSQPFLYKRRILKLTTQLCSLKKRAPPNSVYYRSNSSSRNRQRYRRELQFSFSLKSAQ